VGRGVADEGRLAAGVAGVLWEVAGSGGGEPGAPTGRMECVGSVDDELELSAINCS